MSAKWSSGKVEDVKVGADGRVRQVTISYTDTSSENLEDWIHRTVDRPVRNIVKISHIDETTFMDDINAVHDLAKELMDNENVVQILDDNIDVDIDPAMEANLDKQETTETLDDQHDELLTNEEPQNVPISVPKSRKKRKTELENLEITMKGWNFTRSVSQASPFIHLTTQQDKLSLHMNTVNGWYEGGKEVNREGEDDPDKDFNFVKNDDDCDNIYLL